MSRAGPTPGMRAFARALVGERAGRFAWIVVVQVAAALGQAVCVLLLVPLLGAVGVGASGEFADWIRRAFATVGLEPTLTTVLVLYVVVTAVSAALSAYQSVLSTRYRLEFVDHLRERAYAAVARAEWRHLMDLRQSDVLAVLSTNVTGVGVAAYGALNVLAAAIVVCAQLGAAMRISPALTGLALVSGTALVVIVWPLVRRSRRLGAELVERNRGVLALATGFLDALKLAKAYGREDAHVEAFGSAVAGARRSQVEFARASAIATAVQLTMTALLLAVTVQLAVRALDVPVSSLLVVAFVFTRVVSQVTAAQTSVQQVAQGLPAFDEVMTLIAGCEAAEEVAASPRQRQSRMRIGEGIALHDVHFTYPSADGQQEALRGVSLEIPSGDMVALVGPSGAGKTTIADLAAGLVMPSHGHVAVDGRPLREDSLVAWRQSVALVPQDPFLFHDTIRANLLWARPDASESDLWDALSMAAAADFVARRPGGLDAVVGNRGARLSGGERQRLALARALLREPDLLILDEATSALDHENECAIRAALARLRGQTTILVIAHRHSTAADADLVVVIDAGRVVEIGDWDALSGGVTG